MDKGELEKIATEQLESLAEMEREQAEWMRSEMDDDSPFHYFFDTALAIERVVAQPLFGPRSEERLLHWNILLSFGGPTSRLEIDEDGSGRIVVYWWSPPYVLRFHGVLPMLAEELSAYDDAMAGV